jgi:hypothetical protein
MHFEYMDGSDAEDIMSIASWVFLFLLVVGAAAWALVRAAAVFEVAVDSSSSWNAGGVHPEARPGRGTASKAV